MLSFNYPNDFFKFYTTWISFVYNFVINTKIRKNKAFARSKIIINGTASPGKRRYKVMTKDIDVMRSESDDDDIWGKIEYYLHTRLSQTLLIDVGQILLVDLGDALRKFSIFLLEKRKNKNPNSLYMSLEYGDRKKKKLWHMKE